MEPALNALGVRTLALSTDSVYAHKVFTQISPSASQIRYPLLSDRSGQIPWLYGALNPKEGTAGRVSVLIDPEGRVAAYVAYPSNVGRNALELLRIVQAAQFSRQTGLGAPANWMPGDPGLARSPALVGRI